MLRIRLTEQRLERQPKTSLSGYILLGVQFGCTYCGLITHFLWISLLEGSRRMLDLHIFTRLDDSFTLAESCLLFNSCTRVSLHSAVSGLNLENGI